MNIGNGTRLYVNEVATRDGFQMESRFIPTEDKIALIDRLSGLGYETDLQLGDAYKDFIVKDLEQWRRVAKAANIKIEN